MKIRRSYSLLTEDWDHLREVNDPVYHQMLKNHVKIKFDNNEEIEEFNNEVFDWIDENAKGYNIFIGKNTLNHFYFEKEEDMMAFKLRWS